MIGIRWENSYSPFVLARKDLTRGHKPLWIDWDSNERGMGVVGR
jgi:hypothetical protein